MVIFSAGDYHKKVLPASQLHIEEDIGAHYTRAQLISNGFCTTKKSSVKSNVVYSNLFTSQDELISTLKSYLFSLQHNSPKVKSFFDFDDVLYAA